MTVVDMLPEMPANLPSTLRGYSKWLLRHCDLGHLSRTFAEPIITGSFCTGMLSEGMCMDALSTEWEMAGHTSRYQVAPHFKNLFACEWDDRKRAALLHNHDDVDYIFKDACEMAKGRAWCYKRQLYVDTFNLKPHLVVAGYPCKDLSGLNANPKAFLDPVGTTGGPWRAIMRLVRQWRPPCVLFENVKGITQLKRSNGQRPLTIQDRMIDSWGYTAGHCHVNSTQFMLPQSRPRVYMFYIAKDCGDAADAVDYFLASRVAARPLADFLLVADNMHTTRAPSSRQGSNSAKWKGQIEAIIARHGLPKVEVKQVARDIAQLGIMSDRASHIAATQLVKLKMEFVDTDTSVGVIQVDLNPTRADNVNSRLWGTSPCITPHGAYYIPNLKRMMTDQDKASLQGVGQHEVHRHLASLIGPMQDGKHCRLSGDMAGNGFSTPVCLAALVALLAAWRRDACNT